MNDPIRELLAFLVAKELNAICFCGSPSTVYSANSRRPPVCDKCRRLPVFERFDDFEDLRHAPAMRRLLGTES